MAHYISYSLFDSPYYLDNRSNSRANTCINTQLLVGRVVFIRLKPMRSSAGIVVSHNNCADRMLLAAMNHSSFCPISFGW